MESLGYIKHRQYQINANFKKLLVEKFYLGESKDDQNLLCNYKKLIEVFITQENCNVGQDSEQTCRNHLNL